MRECAPSPSRGALASRRVLADEVAERIARELILSRQVATGGLLPSEKELTERYGVSRVTVRAGLRTLKEAGLISVRQGVGATVLPRPSATRCELHNLCSLETYAREVGVAFAIVVTELEQGVADDETSALLGVPAGGAVGVARCAATLADVPFAWLVDRFRLDAVSLEEVRARGATVLDVLLSRDGAVDCADCAIEPVALPADVAGSLGVDAGTVGLRLDEIVYAADGAPLARCIAWHRQLDARYGWSVRRRRRLGG